MALLRKKGEIRWCKLRWNCSLHLSRSRGKKMYPANVDIIQELGFDGNMSGVHKGRLQPEFKQMLTDRGIHISLPLELGFEDLEERPTSSCGSGKAWCILRNVCVDSAQARGNFQQSWCRTSDQSLQWRRKSFEGKTEITLKYAMFMGYEFQPVWQGYIVRLLGSRITNPKM